jgi:hypothetical protein
MEPELAAVRPRELDVDPHVFRGGFLAGVLAFVAFVGVFKDVYALVDPGRRGELAWGFLMVRYTSLERVWFGYRLTGDAAWYAALPHVAIYGAAILGLLGLRRWGWVARLPLSRLRPAFRMELHVLLPSRLSDRRPLSRRLGERGVEVSRSEHAARAVPTGAALVVPRRLRSVSERALGARLRHRGKEWKHVSEGDASRSLVR